MSTPESEKKVKFLYSIRGEVEMRQSIDLFLERVWLKSFLFLNL